MARKPRSEGGSNPMTGPIRTCIGCRERAPRCELVRVTAGSDTHGQMAVVPDPRGTRPGRGAHLHPTTRCYDLAVRRKAFVRALRVPGGTGAAPVGEWLADSTETPAGPTRNWSSSS